MSDVREQRVIGNGGYWLLVEKTVAAYKLLVKNKTRAFIF